MTNCSTPSKKNEIKGLSDVEAARLAGVIWIYGGIHVSGSDPRIVITMPIPLAYEYEKDFGGHTYRGKDGYFTLQIAGQPLVKKRLEEIQPFMSGEEAEQIRLALEIIQTPKEKKEELKRLIADWKKSKNKLEQWMKEFVENHKKEPVSKIPADIWRKAYLWPKFMTKSGYELVPKMVPPQKATKAK